MRRPVHLALLLLATFAGAGCGRVQAPETGDPGPVSLTVMTFNIEWGGKHVSFAKVVEAIRRSDADVVGIQEAEGNLEELAAELGWHFDERNYVISRFPLLDPPAARGKYVFVELRPGIGIALANLHLPSDPYGPDLVRDGASLDEVLNNERRVRMPMLETYLGPVAQLVTDGFPVFVTGDFNSPSHADWSDELVAGRDFARFAVPWPVTTALEGAGLRDAWRELHPDVAAVPGLTWWAARPPLPDYAPGAGDPQDRIDMIWFAGAAARSAILVGEAGRPGVAVGVDPWPSDHRGVAVTFDVDPVRLPDLLTTDRRVYSEGDGAVVIFRFDTAPESEITITDLDSGRVTARLPLRSARGELRLAQLAPGRFEASANAGGTDHARQFWVLARNAVPRIEVAQAAFAAGEPVLVRWQDAPGNRNDYVAVYAADAAGDNEAMLSYAYIDALPAGEFDLRSAVTASGGTLPPGRYIAKLLKDDGYEALATTKPFDVD